MAEGKSSHHPWGQKREKKISVKQKYETLRKANTLSFATTTAAFTHIQKNILMRSTTRSRRARFPSTPKCQTRMEKKPLNSIWKLENDRPDVCKPQPISMKRAMTPWQTKQHNLRVKEARGCFKRDGNQGRNLRGKGRGGLWHEAKLPTVCGGNGFEPFWTNCGRLKSRG